MTSPGAPSPHGSPSPPPRRRAPGFSPRFTIGLLYLAGFFLLYSSILVAPALLDILRTMPPGPEQQQAALDAARQAARPQIAAGLSIVTTLAGAWFQILPGLRIR